MQINEPSATQPNPIVHIKSEPADSDDDDDVQILEGPPRQSSLASRLAGSPVLAPSLIPDSMDDAKVQLQALKEKMQAQLEAVLAAERAKLTAEMAANIAAERTKVLELTVENESKFNIL